MHARQFADEFARTLDQRFGEELFQPIADKYASRLEREVSPEETLSLFKETCGQLLKALQNPSGLMPSEPFRDGAQAAGYVGEILSTFARECDLTEERLRSVSMTKPLLEWVVSAFFTGLAGEDFTKQLNLGPDTPKTLILGGAVPVILDILPGSRAILEHAKFEAEKRWRRGDTWRACMSDAALLLIVAGRLKEIPEARRQAWLDHLLDTPGLDVLQRAPSPAVFRTILDEVPPLATEDTESAKT